MKFSRVLPLALVMIVALLLAACGGGAASPTATTAPASSGGEATPESSSQSSGGAEGPAAAVQGFFDALYTGQGDISSFVCSTAGVADAYQQAAEASAAAFQGADIDTSGLSYEVSDETADSATVTVSGQVVYSMGGADTPVPFTEAAFSAVNEDGTWKFCGGAVPS